MTDRQPFAFKGVCFSSISCGHNQCYQIWRNFATLAKFKSLKDILGIVLVWYLANVCTYFGNFYATGQIFNDVNGQNVKSNVVIWSHWPQFARFLPPTLFLTFRPPRLFFVVAFTLGLICIAPSATLSSILVPLSLCFPLHRHIVFGSHCTSPGVSVPFDRCIILVFVFAEDLTLDLF